MQQCMCKYVHPGVLAAGGTLPQHRMLHDCFGFKQPSSPQLEPLMEALHIMTGIPIS